MKRNIEPNLRTKLDTKSRPESNPYNRVAAVVININ